ncbi:hypothetical protein GCM10009799_44350 [Nocardiopsis rhodophaea]|uniref:Uncharacterized protein n=1 Tax=Nocardiopsis rhodophaea TaxID=280238 RepID=A0ABN2TU27_9ACTN
MGEVVRRLLAEFVPQGGVVADLMRRSDGCSQLGAVAVRGLQPGEVDEAKRTLAEAGTADGQLRVVAGETSAPDEVVGEVDLALLVPLPARSGAFGDGDRGAYEREVGKEVDRAAELLRPGGYAAVIARHGRPHSGFLDLSAIAVHAVERAELVYIQHVIAITVPIRGEALSAPIGGGGGQLGVWEAQAAARIHHPVHLDVVVCVKPEAAPDATPFPVGVSR